jgi:hypothetical protein
MVKEMFMIEDKWGLYRYWEGYNDTLNTTDEAANQTKSVRNEDGANKTSIVYKKKSKEDDEEMSYSAKEAN